MKQDNSEALKALGYEEPKCNISELHETSSSHEKKAKTLPIQSVINCAFKRLPYVVIHKGKAVKMGRKFNYYTSNEFTLISLYFIHIRLCPTKQDYLNLPQAG